MDRIISNSELSKLKKEDLVTILDHILDLAKDNEEFTDFGFNTAIYLGQKGLINEI